MQEEYIKPPPPNYVPPSSQKCALRPLPEGYPQPALRVSLAHLTIVAALCHTDADQGQLSVLCFMANFTDFVLDVLVIHTCKA